MRTDPSPFNWRGAPSIFAGDKAFAPVGGGSISRAESARVGRETAEQGGKNIGTIHGLTKKARQDHTDPKRFHVYSKYRTNDGAAKTSKHKGCAS